MLKFFTRGLFPFLLGLLLGGGAMFAAFRWHAVRADDGWHWVRNGGSSLGDCYADVRNWTANDWAAHPRLTAALYEGGQGDVVTRTTANGLLDQVLRRR